MNGSRGIIKNIVYDEGKEAPDLPAIVWVETDTYNGPSYFPNDTTSREKSYPIRSITKTWWTENKQKKGGQIGSKADSTDWIENSRRMLPLKLSWALTIWYWYHQMRIKSLTHLNNGIPPTPIITRVKMKALTSVTVPNVPDIIDCNMFSETRGIVKAPSPPTRIYKAKPIMKE